MPTAEELNQVLRAVATSAAFREAMIQGAGDDGLPDWATPYSLIGVRDLSRIANFLAIGPGDTFADLACGLGGPGLWLAERTGATLVGIDHASEAISAARRLAEERGCGERATYVTADMTATGQDTEQFDAAVSIDAIQVVAAAAATAEMARILKPGGRAAVTTWEMATSERPGWISNYRPVFEASGLRIDAYEEPTGWRERHIAQYASLLERRDRIAAEIGPLSEGLFREAEDAPRRLEHMRRVIILARRES
jgi:SAM-dependent methyltransferase